VAIDASDIEACYVRVGRGLFNVLYRMLWDQPACQDVIHDAFLQLWSRRAHLHAAHIDALAYRISLNLARNRLRWNRLRHWVGVEVLDEVTPPPGLEQDQLAELRDLRAAMARLDPRDREIVLLSEYAGLDTEELARLLGIAPGTVGSRKHRALGRLRELLKDSTDG
jgi:RNA polymerase sigma-70 factor (ECF subfamily)